jgi:hypothetical protein
MRGPYQQRRPLGALAGRLEAENAALRQQPIVLQRQVRLSSFMRAHGYLQTCQGRRAGSFKSADLFRCLAKAPAKPLLTQVAASEGLANWRG